MKPGISRRLCRIPISRPVNAARSMAKLSSRVIQTEKLNGTAAAMSISRISGRRSFWIFIAELYNSGIFKDRCRGCVFAAAPAPLHTGCRATLCPLG